MHRFGRDLLLSQGLEVDGDCGGIHRGIFQRVGGLWMEMGVARGALRWMGNLCIHGMGMMLRYQAFRGDLRLLYRSIGALL